MNWSDGRETHRVFSVMTSRNYFTALGVPVAHGRGILPSDPAEVVVLRHEFWRAHYNGDPSIVGKAILLEGKPYTVVGILPPTHRTLIGFGFSPDVYVPAVRRRHHARDLREPETGHHHRGRTRRHACWPPSGSTRCSRNRSSTRATSA